MGKGECNKHGRSKRSNVQAELADESAQNMQAKSGNETDATKAQAAIVEPGQQGKQNNKILPRTRSGRVSTSKFVGISSNNNAVVSQKGLNKNLSLGVGFDNESAVRSSKCNDQNKSGSRHTNANNAKSTVK